MRHIYLAVIAAVATLGLAVPTLAATQANTLSGTDGPGFTITMSKKTVKAGTYVITIHDKSQHPQLPPDGARHQQEDERARDRNDEVDGEAEEGHLQVRLRSPQDDHARRA